MGRFDSIRYSTGTFVPKQKSSIRSCAQSIFILWNFVRTRFIFFFPVDNNAAGTLVTGKHDQLHASQTLTRQFFVLYIRMDTRYVPPRFYRRISRQFFFFLLSSSSLFVSPRCKQIRKLRTRELHLPLVSPIFDHKFGQRICWALNRKFNFHVERWDGASFSLESQFYTDENHSWIYNKKWGRRGSLRMNRISG